MIPIHQLSVGYDKYETAYKQCAEVLKKSPNTSTLQRMLQSLFHYSFHVIPCQERGKSYTPSSISFYASGLIAFGINDIVTRVAEMALMEDIPKELISKLLEDCMLPEVMKFLEWDEELVKEALLSYLKSGG